MSEDDIASFGDATLVTLPLRTFLEPPEPGELGVYFIELGIASVVADIEGRSAVELGIIGYEGHGGARAWSMATTGSRSRTFMQIEGAAYRFDAARVRAALVERPAVHAAPASLCACLLDPGGDDGARQRALEARRAPLPLAADGQRPGGSPCSASRTSSSR